MLFQVTAIEDIIKRRRNTGTLILEKKTGHLIPQKRENKKIKLWQIMNMTQL
jgi:hypothetical protein